MMMKKAVGPYYRAKSQNFLNRLKKTTKMHSQNGWSLGQEVNLGLPNEA
jgi:hypothetical protein